MRGWKNTFHANGKQKKAGVSILISDKVDLKIKKITRDKEGHYIMIKGSIQDEDITIVNIYAPNIGAPQYIRQTLLLLSRFSRVWPHRWQPTRLPHPWDSPCKNTGVGCHFLLQCVKVKSESEAPQSCPTLHNPINYSLPGSSIHGIFQARVLEWGATAFSKTNTNRHKRRNWQ